MTLLYDEYSDVRFILMKFLRREIGVLQQTTLKIASNKMTKHEKTCSYNQHAFMPFVFDTLNFLTPDVVDPLQMI